MADRGGREYLHSVLGHLFRACRLLAFLTVGAAALWGCRDSTSAETLPPVKSDGVAPGENTDGDSALTPDQRLIRVLLNDQLLECRIHLPQPFELRDLAGHDLVDGGCQPMDLEIRFQDESITLPSLDLEFDHPVEICPAGSDPVSIEWVGEAAHVYPGRLRVFPGTKDGRGGALVNVVDVEDYLIGVVTAELHQGFLRAACRAQAIASRTYAWYWIEQRREEGDWDLRASEGAQVYLGLDRAEQVPEATQAVRDTEGLVLTWNGPEGRRIFCAYYSSTCGGRTQPAGPVMHQLNIPPLAGGVTCAYCRDAPRYHWGPLTLSQKEITEALRSRYEAFEKIGPITRIEVTQEEVGGRAVLLRLYDARGRSLPLEAENFRLAVDSGGRRVQSTWFTIQTQEDSFRFLNGRGFGHGVGLCQYGAQGMAARGASAIRILQFYYPESQVVRAY